MFSVPSSLVDANNRLFELEKEQLLKDGTSNFLAIENFTIWARPEMRTDSHVSVRFDLGPTFFGCLLQAGKM